ncbi:MAG: protein kinase [Candidatus Poribacteria bacterium]|nr:protein kinase [Candidatus Poribacteria bacterium]
MQIDGLVLGKYRIERLINTGNFASVFQATEVLTTRAVAIKMLAKSIYPAGRRRYLLTELSALGMNWRHPNIVSIHTVEPGDDQYVAYIVMEYVDGPSLRQLMSVRRPSPDLAINIALDICRGLIAAHAHNIIHRDIKPQNILLTTDQTAQISDFGVARILETTSDYAETITGTRKYMAPEQYEGNYDCRADLYSTGLILCEMLMGRFPFRGKTHDEIQIEKQYATIEFSDDHPEDLRAFLQKALHRDVRARYQTAAEMYDDLDRIRKQWYVATAEEIMTNYSDTATRCAALTKRREDLRLPIEVAEKIELEVRDKQKAETEKQKQIKREGEANAHYDQATEYLRLNQPQQALQEMQQAHRLYLSSVPETRKADWIFRNLLDLSVIPKPHSTAADLIDLINPLPANEILALKSWFYNQFPPSELSESSSRFGSDVRDIDSDSSSGLPPQASQAQEPNPEFVLRKLHEVIHNPHEMIASQIRQSAEDYTQQGKHRRARAAYKRLGDFYRSSGTSFIEADDWETGADCHARAWLAYTAARRYGSARRRSREAGTYYAKLADLRERRLNWTEAGKFYTLSAECYAHAELPEAADQSRLGVTICYFNVAENAYAEGNLNLAYDYCEKILMIGKEMQRASRAVTGARKLIQEIEMLFTANQ